MTVSSAPPSGTGRERAQAYQVLYASFEGRVAAGALDGLVLVIIASLFVSAGSLVVLFSSDFERVDASATAINFFWVCIVSIIPAYFLYFFIGLAWKGQTIGAAVMQIMVIRLGRAAAGRTRCRGTGDRAAVLRARDPSWSRACLHPSRLDPRCCQRDRRSVPPGNAGVPLGGLRRAPAHAPRPPCRHHRRPCCLELGVLVDDTRPSARGTGGGQLVA